MNNFTDHNITIEGVSYVVQPIPAMKGLSYMRRLTKVLGASLAALFSQSQEEGDVEEAGLQKAVELLVENMDKEDVEKLIVDLISTVLKDGKALNFNAEFTANYGILFKLLTEVIKVNFGSLFQLGAIEM
jgi:hypothetical protein